jgi:hypothetical protein
MVPLRAALNRAGWNAVSSPAKRRGRIAAAPAGGSIAVVRGIVLYGIMSFRDRGSRDRGS